jgi:LmbE family N-acetylglucosaminyl deacetylase
MIPVGTSAVDGASRLLLLGAHPDDIELGCGGTVLALARRRPDLHVRWVVMSGTPERAAEARASAEAFLDGVADVDVVVHDFADRYFPAEYRNVKQAVVAAHRDFEPDLIFTHQRNDLHQDHRLVSELTLNAFRDHLILEYEVPKYDGDLGQPNVYVELDSDAVHDKAALLRKHFPSQHERDWFDEETFRAILRLRGVECHATHGFAEAFYGRKMRLL